jgi:hypothetical protein
MLENAPTAAAAGEPSDGKVRVFVTDSQSWETRGSGGGGGNKNGWGASGSFSGGAAADRGNHQDAPSMMPRIDCDK